MWHRLVLVAVLLTAVGCDSSKTTITESPEGYRLSEGTQLTLVLETHLSSNRSQRLDLVQARLKSPLTWEGKALIPMHARVKGWVKRVERFDKPGDRAALGIVFDQIELPNGVLIPIVALLDTDSGINAIKVKGEALKNAKIMNHAALAGSMIGDAVLQGQGSQKGIAIGAGLGSSAIVLSKAREINLPLQTELIVQLSERILIPKETQ